ncbi:unnamed protein product [Trichogramma brassicae]|uniref:Uncharacterized protein n=1 Tax=Trichogramma brassicae TaxID=86971 RepID=A0A6H5J3I0_9HYME|nr:unnamed protein product [Trichogramma brassicae]
MDADKSDTIQYTRCRSSCGVSSMVKELLQYKLDLYIIYYKRPWQFDRVCGTMPRSA